MRDKVELSVSRGTALRLNRLRELILEESRYQNLIGPSTISQFDSRHVADSLQLVHLLQLKRAAPSIVDIGSGAGFPGLVLAIATHFSVTLVEPRARRAAFLRAAAEALHLDNVQVIASRAEAIDDRTFDIVTARAVATLDRLLAMTSHLAHAGTVWLLLKGRSVHDELAVARRSWQGQFEVRPSLTSPEAGIVIACDVQRRRLA